MTHTFNARNLRILPLGILFFFAHCTNPAAVNSIKESDTKEDNATVIEKPAHQIDKADFDQRMLALSNGDTTGKWPTQAPYPLPGAILPYNRIIAFYGNLYSKRMGILGELPKDSMFKRLKEEVSKWNAADSVSPAIPALHYIAATAQASPGKEKKHRMRMPFHQIDTIIKWADEIKALVFVDIQVGHSTVKEETAAWKNIF